jgi:hypothetical protein
VTFTFSHLGQFQGDLGRVVEGRHVRTVLQSVARASSK